MSAAAAEPLTRTKLAPPRLPPRAVALDRQRALMSGVLAHSLCLVRAPHGYGKSTLCSNWHNAFAAQGCLTGWVSFERDDNDASRAISYLLCAILEPLQSDVPLASDGLIPPQSLAAYCINAVHDQARPLVLFLDDFDKLNDPHLLQFVNYILLHCPENLHIVAACQVQPALPLAYLDAHGGLLRIGIDDLRLREDEACQLLDGSGPLLARDEVARLNDAMAGWITGLRIGSAALRNNRDALDDIGLVGHGAGWLGDYLDENIFQHLTAASRRFLTRCSVVETLTPDLCATLAGDGDTRRILAWLADQNLFIQRLDDAGSCFRIHPVFREFLATKLREDDPALPQQLHGAASRWFADHGRTPEAVRHALDAGETGRAAELLSTVAMSMVERSDILGLLNWISQIPDAEVARHIPLRVAQAWALTLSLRPQARKLIDDLGGQVAALDDVTQRALYLIELAGLETIFLAVCEDRIDAALARGRTFLERPVAETSFTARAVRNAAAFCELGRGDYRAAGEILRPAQLQAMRSEQLFTTAYRHTIVGLAYRQQGQLAEAERTFRDGVDLAERLAGRESPSAVLVASFLARSLYERDAIAEARATLAGRLGVIDEACYHEAVINAYQVAVRVAVIEGQSVEAARLIDHVELLGHERGWRRLLAQCAVERLRLGLLQTTDLDDILPRSREEAALAEPLGLDARTFTILAKPRLMLALAAGDTARAREVAERYAVLASRVGSAEMRLTSALLAMHLEPEPSPEHQGIVTDAIARGFGRTIIDLLSETQFAKLIDAEPRLGLQNQLLFLRDQIGTTVQGRNLGLAADVSPTLFSVLTSREIDVLTGVSRSRSNKEIARQIHLTPETVKWHLKNIMRKLGVDSRKAAVEQGIRLGMSTSDN